MKRTAAIFLAIVTLLLTSCAPETARTGGVVVRSDLPAPTNIEAYYKYEDIVYVTKSGTKYHKDGCPYLKSSKIMISLQQAVMEGKKPCSRCFSDNETVKEPD